VTETHFYISVAVMPITTIVIVLIGVLLNNSNMNSRLSDFTVQVNNRFNDINARLNEMNASLNRRIDDTKDLLRAEIAKNHSEMLGKFAELDIRLSRIESHLHLN
jgi:hypothetical protein